MDDGERSRVQQPNRLFVTELGYAHWWITGTRSLGRIAVMPNDLPIRKTVLLDAHAAVVNYKR